MDQSTTSALTHRFPKSRTNQIFLGILVLSIVLGVTTGYLMSNKTTSSPGGLVSSNSDGTIETPKSAQQDKSTFRDFADGTIEKRPAPKNPNDYVEGTHILRREKAVPVALTSSVVDLSQYEGKKVKVYGETQKALKEGWLMDVGLVEEQ